MTLGIGIIGYGGMGGWHQRHVDRLDGFKVTAIHDIDPARVKAAEDEGIPAYLSLAEFLSDSSYDAVIIATPNDVHMELAIAAAAAGKNVISEKPVALSVAQLDEMIAAAKRHNVLFTVHQNRRWDKDFRIAKTTIEKGLIGKTYIIESRVHGPNGIIHGWRAEKEHGGGMLYDWGVHMIDQLLWMISTPVKSVNCVMRSVLNPDVDDYFRMQIEFTDGLLAYVEVGTLCLRPLPRWYVGGDAGTLWIDDFAGKGGITALKRASEASRAPLEDNPAGPTRTFGKEPTTEKVDVPLPDENPDFNDFYRNVKAAIEGKEELVVKPAEVRRVLTVMEAGFESARTNQPVVFAE